MSKEFRSATRVHNSVLARVEKKALVWMAERAPAWLNSDHLTLLGLLSMMGAGAAYALTYRSLSWLWAVNVCLALNWLGDSLDGTLARVRDRQRPRYGFYVDHVVDAVAAVFLLTGMGAAPFMTAAVAVALLIAYLLLSIESYLATYAVGDFHISHFGFGPTELRILLIAGNLFLFRDTHASILGRDYLLFDIGGAVAAALMGITFVIAAGRHTACLYREETR